MVIDIVKTMGIKKVSKMTGIIITLNDKMVVQGRVVGEFHLVIIKWGFCHPEWKTNKTNAP